MPIIPADSDTPAVTDDEIFQEAAERLRIATAAQGSNIADAIEDLEFEDGHQWPADLYKLRKNRPTLTINHTKTFVRRVVNNMRQQRPRIKVHPVGDGARVEDAKVISGLIRHIETQSKASVAYDGAGESAVKIGWGYARILTDYVSEDSFEQELKITPIRNVFTVYDDPSAVLPTGSDRDWLLITQKMKRQEYKRKYPNAQNLDFRKGGPGDDEADWESKHEIRLAEYYRVTRKTEMLYQLTDGTTLFERDYQRMKAALAQRGVVVAATENGNEKKRPSFRRYIEWYKLNGREIIDRRSVGSKAGPLPGHWIPVVRFEGNVLDLNGEIRRRGMVRDLKDANRMYNYWATCETELVALAPRAPWLAAEGQLDGHPEWKTANQSPHSALIYKPVTVMTAQGEMVLPPPQRNSPMEIPAAVVGARQGTEHDLMALAGMPHEPGQDSPGQVVSGKALRQRQALSDIGHFQYYDNQTMAIAHVGEILLDLIPYYYSESRMQRIIGEDGVPQMVPINQKVMGPDPNNPQVVAIHEVKNNLTVGRYDVVMDTGPGYETKRQEGQEAVIDLLKTPLAEPIVKTGADLIVRNMDFAGADDLADRLMVSNPQGMQKAIQSLPKEAQGIVVALQQQLQQTQEALQHAHLEIKFKTNIEQGWMAVERDKTHSTAQAKIHDTQTNANVKIHDTHVKAVTAHDVAEIQAGAQLLNTNTEAAHDRRAAKDLIEHAEKAERSNGKADA